MFCAGVVLPHPPLLVPDVASGAAAELATLRSACAAALAEALERSPDRVILVGTAAESGETSGPPTLAPYGLPGPRRGLPLSLTIGTWLLEAAGWRGATELRTVPADATAAQCATLGAELVAAPGRTALAVLGDGSARRSAAAPGHLDERAAGFDAAVAGAFATGDIRGLLGLDAALAAELLAVGRAPWQVLAGAADAFRTDVAAPDAGLSARLHYAEAPYGVGYFVAAWCPAL